MTFRRQRTIVHQLFTLNTFNSRLYKKILKLYEKTIFTIFDRNIVNIVV